MARLQGKNVVEQEDVDTFYKLFSAYLESFSRMQCREDLESTITVSSGHMELLTEIVKHLEGITKQDLSSSLLVSVRHIERCASFLLRKGLIREEEGKYYLSTELTQFFNWYKDTFSV
jgi:DNA replicative helicase MCM subunit Mcm2 (Cdc46/Mcm family)